MKKFDIPVIYHSPLISAIKTTRKAADKMKKDFTPFLLDLGNLHIYLARHFGFCYGVENAIEISFRTVDENPGRNIYLLSEMIHNPHVNADLQSRGIQFLQDTHGKQLIPFETLQPDDIVIIPAFGATLEIEATLKAIGIQTERYNTTCPFVEKVWNRSAQIAKNDYSIVVHGKPGHEETRATFSHAAAVTPTVVVRDMAQTLQLAEYIKGTRNPETFYTEFAGQFSPGFDIKKDLTRIGVVNQTTMLASDTQAIADFLKQTMLETFGNSDTRPAATEDPKADASADKYFADTRDTLCYATLDNQTAVTSMLDTPADLAIVVGGYNSANTSHLVELCEEKMPAFFIRSDENLLSPTAITHYNFHEKKELTTQNWLPDQTAPAPVPARPAIPTTILLTSGASCPDSMVESVIRRLAQFYDAEARLDLLTAQLASQAAAPQASA